MSNGTKVIVSTEITRFSWTIQSTKLTFDVMFIPLMCCDFLLGIKWILTLGDIT